LITVFFIDPCTLETPEAFSELSFEQIDETLSIWWEPFSTGYPDWCFVDVTEVKVGSFTFDQSTLLGDP
jgi:hypothetical protein